MTLDTHLDKHGYEERQVETDWTCSVLVEEIDAERRGKGVHGSWFEEVVAKRQGG